jgi:hypothetical protein
VGKLHFGGVLHDTDQADPWAGVVDDDIAVASERAHAPVEAHRPVFECERRAFRDCALDLGVGCSQQRLPAFVGVIGQALTAEGTDLRLGSPEDLASRTIGC